ncbi:Short-chain dehydrogenase reductase 3b [Lachnellula suecica]|uniref:Short-chain dehydrogenase reductase 3b n=1 Tax=Lachnellula suecica TaxID=602035 RepID=A0A8T9CJQ3_9HELO|nr:Short-chain dehydrogenase reductase 3b [Lachnellula suecica]
MTHIEFDPSLLETLKDKVVVLTGGATGIGRAAVHLYHENGASIVFGDVADGPGQQLANELGSQRAAFIHCDTTSYSDQLALFAKAKELYGRVDIVVANAGMSIPQDPFSADADINIEPSTRELDVNLKGAMFTARIGTAYLRQKGGGDLIMTSSIAGFKECTGLTAYTASKHGVIGIMRGLHLAVIPEDIRVNVICPWMTKTAMVKGIEKGWAELKLPANEPQDVALAILTCSTANRSQNGKTHKGAVLPLAGKILFVAGGKSYEIEDALQRLEPQWLGAENSRVLEIGQDYLMNSETSWDTTKSSNL